MKHFKVNGSIESRELLPTWSDGVWRKTPRGVATVDDALADRVLYIEACSRREPAGHDR